MVSEFSGERISPADPRDHAHVYSAEYIRELTPQERKDLRRQGILPQAKQVISRLQSQSKAISELELRVAIFQRLRRTHNIPHIAEALGRTKQKIYQARRAGVRASAKRYHDTEMYGAYPPPDPPIPPRFWKSRLWKYRMKALPPFTRDPDPETGEIPEPDPLPKAAHGEILDAPEVVQMRKDALMLRKAMKTFAEIGDYLGISEKEAKQYVYDALQELQQLEANNADIERRLMIAQLDEMIAAIHPMSTGKDVTTGRQQVVVLHAIDRSIKLLAKKAELLGLTEPPALDIRLKLQEMAADLNCDIVDLEDIARGVLQSHKIRLPDF